jgi:hypothetical protein
MLDLVIRHLGGKKTAVYDGSWQEYKLYDTTDIFTEDAKEDRYVEEVFWEDISDAEDEELNRKILVS